MNQSLQILRFICLAFFIGMLSSQFYSCSNRLAPDGGPKDTLNPFVTSIFPKDQSTNFRGDKVILEFNEWVREKNFRQELLITPPNTAYIHKVTRNRVEIKLEDSLKQNTTYSFNFRNSIEDITEGNVALLDTLQRKNLKIAFSTGPVIDSMQVSGNVVNRLTNEPFEAAVVALYPLNDTLVVDEDSPYYYSLSDEEGNFSIENIKAGVYELFAFSDPNNNSTYEEPELIDFLSESIELNAEQSHIHDVELKLAAEDQTPPRIRTSKTQDAQFQIEFSEGLIDYEVRSIQSSDSNYLSHQLISKGRVIEFYNRAQVFDSIQVEVSAIDSIGNQSDSSTYILFNEIEAPKSRRNERKANPRASLGLDISAPKGNGFEEEYRILFDFARPVGTYDFRRIRYLPDQDSSRLAPLYSPDSSDQFQWNKNFTRLSIRKPYFNFQKSIQIEVDSAAFISVLGDSTRLVNKTLNRKDAFNFGSIYGTVQTESPSFIIELLSTSGEVMGQALNSTDFEFSFLPAGTYSMRVILDKNQNGQWDSSDWRNRRRAEEIIFLPLQNEGKLRERWDIEAILIF